MNSIKKIIVFSALILVSRQKDMKCMFDTVNNASDKEKETIQFWPSRISNCGVGR